MDVLSRQGLPKGEGVWGRGGCQVAPGRRLADDGKRLDSLSPRWTLNRQRVKLGKGSGEGGVPDRTGWDVGG